MAAPAEQPQVADDKVELLHDLLGRAATPSPPLASLKAAVTTAFSGHRRLVLGAAIVVVIGLGLLALVMSRRNAAPPVELSLPRAGAVSSVPAASSPVTSAPGPAGPTLTVYVVGAVARPGVVDLPAGARVGDAVNAAGGATPDADLRRINLAAKVADGQQIDVPRPGEVPVVADGGGTVAAADGSGAAAPVDLNTATVAQLDTLPGIGPSTAAAIVEYRSRNGHFASVDELDEVRGIGPARLEQLRELVTVGP